MGEATTPNMHEVPIEQLYSHPIVQELLEKVENADLEAAVKLPYIIKDKILMSPGLWNGFLYDPGPIQEAYLQSEWGNKEVRSLFLDHEDLKSSEWIGEVINPRMDGDTLIGDLAIVDKPTAIKLAYGAKMGISPKVSGSEDEGRMMKFKYDNFSVVINPAVKTAYINNSEKSADPKSKDDASYGDVKYADPGYQKDKKKRYPIDTEKHVRAAWSYISMPKNRKFYTADQVKKIESRIKAAAKKYGISIKNQEGTEMADENTETTPVAAEPQGEPANAEATETVNEMSAKDVVGMLSEIKSINEKTLAAIEKISVKNNEEEAPAEPAEPAKPAEEPQPAEPVEPEAEKPAEPAAPEEPAQPDVSNEMAEQKKVISEMSASIKKKDGVIAEMSERLTSLEGKFNEPQKQTVSAEMSDAGESANPDVEFMNMLKNN